MIAIDATPLALPSPGGVRRALANLLAGLAALDGRPPVHLVAPGPLPPDVRGLDGVHRPAGASLAPAAFRRGFLPRALADIGAHVLFVPFAATPRVTVPVVAFVHELPHVRLGAIEGWTRRWRFARATRVAVRRAHILCVPSQATAQDLVASTGAAPARVRVTGNAFDPAPWEAARPTRPGPDVVAVGTGAGAAGARKKGMDVLARVAASRPDLTFALVGRSSVAMPANVTVRPAVEEGELRGLVAGARALVHPARSEGFGYPPLEAMAAGVPVVATRGGALPEILRDAAYLVPPGDAAALAAGLARVLEDADLRADLVARGRTRARAFHPAAVARRILDALAEAQA